MVPAVRPICSHPLPLHSMNSQCVFFARFSRFDSAIELSNGEALVSAVNVATSVRIARRCNMTAKMSYRLSEKCLEQETDGVSSASIPDTMPLCEFQSSGSREVFNWYRLRDLARADIQHEPIYLHQRSHL